MNWTAYVVAMLVAIGAADASVCKGLEPCVACKDCSSCWHCSPKNPARGSCGVVKAQSDKAYEAAKKKREDEEAKKSRGKVEPSRSDPLGQ